MSIIASSTPTIEAGINGKYRVEVVSKNGCIRRPFGDEFRNNMIMDTGLKYIIGYMPNSSTGIGYASDSGLGLDPFFWTGGLNTIYRRYCRAELGLSATAAAKTQTTLQTPVTPTAKISTSVPTSYTCALDSTNYATTGEIIAKTQHQFDAETTTVTYWEAAIWPNYSAVNGWNVKTFFSRFVFPSALVVNADEFVRLEYQVSFKIPAVVSPGIRIEGGTFESISGMNVAGYLRLVGTATQNFGSVSPAGVWTGSNCYSPFPIGAVGGATSGTVIQRSSAKMLAAGFSSPGSGGALSASIATGSSTVEESPEVANTNYLLTSTDDQASRVFGIGGTYTFPVNNPTASVSIGGILIRSASYNEATTNTNGWLWTFDNPQTASNVKRMTFNVLQRIGVSRNAEDPL